MNHNISKQAVSEKCLSACIQFSCACMQIHFHACMHACKQICMHSVSFCMHANGTACMQACMHILLHACSMYAACMQHACTV